MLLFETVIKLKQFNILEPQESEPCLLNCTL